MRGGLALLSRIKPESVTMSSYALLKCEGLQAILEVQSSNSESWKPSWRFLKASSVGVPTPALRPSGDSLWPNSGT